MCLIRCTTDSIHESWWMFITAYNFPGCIKISLKQICFTAIIWWTKPQLRTTHLIGIVCYCCVYACIVSYHQFEDCKKYLCFVESATCSILCIHFPMYLGSYIILGNADTINGLRKLWWHHNLIWAKIQ